MNLQLLKRCPIVLLLLFVFRDAVLSQGRYRVITGKVINQDTKEPLRGVSVSVKGTSRGVITDEQGVFSLPVIRKTGPVTLLVSYIGFDMREFRTTGDSAVIVSLVNSNKKMDDVVVVGYGTQKRSNILGSVATIDPKEVEDLPAANLSTLLVNQVPGVGVNQTSGKPGATTN